MQGARELRARVTVGASMAAVINRTTLQYFASVNTPDYDPGEWIIEPDLSAVAGVDPRYWKIVGDAVLPMNQAERDAVDAAEAAADQGLRRALLTDAPTIAVPGAFGGLFECLYDVVLGGDRLLGNPGGLLPRMDGKRMLFRIRQDATGGRLLSYGSAYRFSPGLPAPVLSSAPNRVDYLAFRYNHTDLKLDFVAHLLGFG